MTDQDQIRTSFEHLERIAAENRGESLRKKIGGQVGDWRHNRQLYPGWIVAPWSNRATLYAMTVHWVQPILAELPNEISSEQIRWLRELVWRLDICLFPLDQQLASAVRVALESCGFGTAEDFAHPYRFLKADVDIEDCCYLAESLLRYYREQGDAGEFDKLDARLVALVPSNPDRRSHLTHERVLLHLQRLEHVKAAALVAGWPLPVGNPIWAVRRAALAAEFGLPDGQRLLREALSMIENTQPRGPVYEATDFHLLSCEGWALINLAMLDDSPRQNGSLERRLAQLGSVHCDPFATLERMRSVVGNDDGRRRQPHKASLDEPSSTAYAFQTQRLIEVGGRLVRLGIQTIGASLLDAAARWIADVAPERATLLLLRLCNAKTFEEVLDADVASRLSSDQVAKIAWVCRKALAEAAFHVSRPQELAQYNSSQAIKDDRIRDQAETALSGLRALSSRMTSADLDAVVRECSALCRNWRSGVWQVRMYLDETSSVALRVMTAEQRSHYLLELLEQPLAGKDPNIPALVAWHSDPIRLLVNGPPADRSKEPTRWQEAIEALIHETVTTTNERTRANGLLRCAVLFHLHALSAGERERLAAAVWAQAGLATRFPLPIKFFLMLPEDIPGKAARAVRSWVKAFALPRFALDINGERRWNMDPSQAYDIVANVLATSQKPFDGREPPLFGPIEWPQEDVARILEKIEGWWLEEGKDLFDHLKEPNPWPGPDWRFTSIVELLAYVVFPHASYHIAVAARLLKSFAEAGIEIAVASPLLVFENPSKAKTIAATLREAIASADIARIVSAYGGAFIWFADNGRSLPQIPFDFPKEIAATISRRRRPELDTALYFANKLNEFHSSRLDAEFWENIRVGLHHLRLETASPSIATDDGCTPAQRVNERRLAIDLLIAYASTADSHDATVIGWFDAAENEPIVAHRQSLLAAREQWLNPLS